MSDLIAATYQLRVQYKSFSLDKEIVIPADDEVLRFPAEFQASFHVFNCRGMTLDGGMVQMTRGGKSVEETYNGSNVLFTIPPGQYLVTVFSQDHLIGQRSLDLLSDRTVDLVTSEEPLFPLLISAFASFFIFIGVALGVIKLAKEGLVADVGLARARSNATTKATGIDGGGGYDQIENTGTIGATAKAAANAVAVSLAVGGTKQGVAGGAALTDTRTTANATAVGIKAGSASDGKDSDRGKGGHEDPDHKECGSKHNGDKGGSITNANAITVDAEAKTLNVSASVNVGVAKEGVAIGAALADSRATSQATAKGIEGNSDANEIG